MKVNVLINQMIRLLRVAQKPTREELEKTARVVGSLMLVLGLLGVIVSVAFSII